MKKKKTISMAVLAAALVVGMALLITKVIIPANNYKKAEALLADGKYREAIAAFEALGDYRDSADQITKCETAIKDEKYTAAVALIDSGAYESAYILLNGLEYKDSASKLNSIKPQYQKILLSKAQVGSHVSFGAYEQDNNTSNGKEDIEWLVLAKEGDRMLVISKYALDCRQYNTSYTDVTWETCSLRKWLNGTFLSNAFSSDEQNMILSTTVTADKNPSYSTDPGNNTTDKVFLLSITEANKYFNSENARKCQATAYCYAQGAYKSDNGLCWWWLRSPGYRFSNAARVSSGGYVGCGGCLVFSVLGAVRPALWINLGP